MFVENGGYVVMLKASAKELRGTYLRILATSLRNDSSFLICKTIVVSVSSTPLKKLDIQSTGEEELLK